MASYAGYQHYKDMDYDGGGGYIPTSAKLKTEQPKPLPEKPKKKVNFATVVRNAETETSEIKVVQLEVEPQGSFGLDKIPSSTIVSLKRMYSLSRNVEEFNHFSMLFDQVFKIKSSGIPNPSRYNIESFCTLILGIREISAISPNPINVLKINSVLHLEEEFIKNKKYLYFSDYEMWKQFLKVGTIDNGKVRIQEVFRSFYGFIPNNFTTDEIKALVKHKTGLQGSNLDRVTGIIYTGEFEFKLVVTHCNSYFKNQALLREYDIDFDKVNIKDVQDVSDFFLKISNISSYKILNKIFSRLNSSHREAINSNKLIFESFLKFANKMSSENLSFSQIEPILSRVHTYKNINVLLNGLYGIVSEFNIYSTFEKCKTLKGAKIVYFNEADQVTIVKISRYSAMRELGSPSWCVQHIEERYNQYTKGFNRFYIFIDAKAKRKSFSKIGFTIAGNGHVVEACDLENRGIRGQLDNFYIKYGKYMSGFFFKDAWYR